jgi:XRE family aerobic/anaerobic benzoate catabolism transcriptional regulator
VSHPPADGKHAPAANGRDASDEAVGAYISRIAERVKTFRMRRGMTRKLLSVHSGISERYLSQIESGQANLSMALLWRVAHALDTEVQELLPDCGNCGQLPAPLFRVLKQLDALQLERAGRLLAREFLVSGAGLRGVALIGLRGAGKTELGRSLSNRTGIPYVNLVEEVQALSGMNVGELFSLGGQKAYRRFERQALEKVIERSGQSIVEAGGSLVTRRDTFQLLLKNYYTVWIKAAPEEHMERVMAQGDLRPMQGSAGAMDDLKRILEEREPEYRAAHGVLDTSGRTAEQCLHELADQVCGRLEWRTVTASG